MSAPLKRTHSGGAAFVSLAKALNEYVRKHQQAYYNVTKARFLLFVWDGVKTHSLLTLRQTGGPFTPPSLAIAHSSRVNIIYGLDAFFPEEPIMKEPILRFLPLSRTLCVTLRLLGRWMELFPFSAFFQGLGRVAPAPVAGGGAC